MNSDATFRKTFLYVVGEDRRQDKQTGDHTEARPEGCTFACRHISILAQIER